MSGCVIAETATSSPGSKASASSERSNAERTERQARPFSPPAHASSTRCSAPDARARRHARARRGGRRARCPAGAAVEGAETWRSASAGAPPRAPRSHSTLARWLRARRASDAPGDRRGHGLAEDDPPAAKSGEPLRPDDRAGTRGTPPRGQPALGPSAAVPGASCAAPSSGESLPGRCRRRSRYARARPRSGPRRGRPPRDEPGRDRACVQARRPRARRARPSPSTGAAAGRACTRAQSRRDSRAGSTRGRSLRSPARARGLAPAGGRAREQGVWRARPRLDSSPSAQSGKRGGSRPLAISGWSLSGLDPFGPAGVQLFRRRNLSASGP